MSFTDSNLWRSVLELGESRSRVLAEQSKRAQPVNAMRKATDDEIKTVVAIRGLQNDRLRVLLFCSCLSSGETPHHLLCHSCGDATKGMEGETPIPTE